MSTHDSRLPLNNRPLMTLVEAQLNGALHALAHLLAAVGRLSAPEGSLVASFACQPGSDRRPFPSGPSPGWCAAQPCRSFDASCPPYAMRDQDPSLACPGSPVSRDAHPAAA